MLQSTGAGQRNRESARFLIQKSEVDSAQNREKIHIVEKGLFVVAIKLCNASSEFLQNKLAL